MAVFTSDSISLVDDQFYAYGYSYILGWVAFGLSFILSIIAAIAARA